MQRTHLDKKIAFMADDPQNVRLIPCPVCKIETNHFRTAGGWKCRVCDDVVTPEERPDFPSGSLTQKAMHDRRDSILYEVAKDPGLLTDELIGELSELSIELDGSDTSWAAQLSDAGYPGGIY